MISGLALLAALLTQAPSILTIGTVRGEQFLPVALDASGAPVVPAAGLISALDGTVRISGSWAEAVIARQPLRFLLGAPFLVQGSRVQPLAASAFFARDTLYMP
ncbi:MAG: hypothetical protein H0U85_02130, partial [Gemmatimonadales bacterium]|nr:hypothetical protein [Gemmatimonadales bacterium]